MIKDRIILESKDIWRKVGEIPLDYINTYLCIDVKTKGELMKKVSWDDICNTVYEWESNFNPKTEKRINVYKFLRKWR